MITLYENQYIYTSMLNIQLQETSAKHPDTRQEFSLERVINLQGDLGK